MTDCCTKGSLHEHTGSVEEGTFGGKPAYIARPSTPTATAIVYVSDVFGWKLPNARVIADKFAAEGFLCVIPDVLDGDWLPLDAFNSGFTPALQEWFAKHGDAEAICGHLDAVVAELKEKHGIKKVATIGFCWGARFSVLASGSSLKSGKAMFDCFAVAHPTRVAVPADIEALTVSGIFLCAEKDQAFTPENVEQSKKVTKDLSERNPSLSYVFEHYPGTEHGFVVRGGDDTLEQRNAAFKAAADFFKKHL